MVTLILIFNLRNKGNQTPFLILLKHIVCPEPELNERILEHSPRDGPQLKMLFQVR